VRTAVILNSSSGFDDKQSAADAVWQAFRDAGSECDVREVAAGTDIGSLAREAIENGARRVVAGGGDGTLRAVAAALAGTGAEMGLLPVGTLNHFARDMKIPLDDLVAAARIAASGTTIAVDVAEVNGQVFLNNAVMGLYPVYRAARDRQERQGWGSRSAILRAIWRTIRRYPLMTVRLVANGLPAVRRTAYIMVANNEHAMEGWKPWQRERLTEGMLWVYLLRDRSRLAWIRVLATLLRGGSLGEREFEVFEASEVRVEMANRHISISLDGEILDLQPPLLFRSRPRDLRVVVAPDSERIGEVLCER
jgi:YegS/Rv2252/BmrU family lipid kinase